MLPYLNPGGADSAHYHRGRTKTLKENQSCYKWSMQVETLPDGMYSSNFVMGFVKVVYRNGVCTVHITWDVKSVRTVNAVF